MTSKYTNKNGEKKLLTVMMALAMVLVAGFVIIGSSGDADASSTTTSGDSITDGTVITADGKVLSNITVNAGTAAAKLFVQDGVTVTVNGATGSTGTITIYPADSTCGNYEQDVSIAVQALTSGSITVKAEWNATSTDSKLYVSGNASSATAVTITNGDVVATGSSLELKHTVDVSSLAFGAYIQDGADTNKIYYPVGGNLGTITLSVDGSTVAIRDASAVVQQNVNKVTFDKVTSDDIAVSYTTANGVSIAGTVSNGKAVVNAGLFNLSDTNVLVGASAVELKVLVSTGPDTYKYYAANQVVDEVNGKPVKQAIIIGDVTQKNSVGFNGPINLGENSKYYVNKNVVIGSTAVVTFTHVGADLFVFGTVEAEVAGAFAADLFIGPFGYAVATETAVEEKNTNNVSGIDPEIKVEPSGPSVTDAIVGGDFAIPAGQTFTVLGNLGLNGNDITVNGTLVVESGATIFGTGSEKIILGPNGNLIINGQIATDLPIIIQKVKADGITVVGDISVVGITGFSIAVKSDVLTVSGNITKISGAHASILNLTAAAIDGQLTVGAGVTLESVADTMILNGSTVQVDGTFAAQLKADEIATVIVNGTLSNTGADIKIKTGLVSGSSYVSISTDQPVKGLIVYNEKIGTGDSAAYIPYIYGNIQKVDSAATVTIGSAITVPEGEKLVVNNGVTVSVTKLVLNGEAVVKDSPAVASIADYDGAKYTVTDDTTSTTITYFKTLAGAMASASEADEKTVTAKVASVEGNIVVLEGQTLNLTATEVVESAIITAKKGSTFDPTITTISGKVIIESGATLVTEISNYDSKTEMDDGSVVYSSLKVSLDDAKEGSVVSIKTSTTENLVIKSGVTLIIEDTLTVTKGLTVSEGAKLVGGDVVVNGTASAVAIISVAGELDLSAGNLYGSYNRLVATGKVILNTEASDMVGACYTDDSGNIILTTLSEAAKSGKDITVTGNYVSEENVTVDGFDLSIASGQIVSVGTITIVDGVVTSQGDLTAVVTDGTASVSLNKASISIQIVDGKLTVDAIDGKVGVTSGKVYTTGSITATAGSTLEIIEGAEFTVSASSSLTVTDSGAKVIIEGVLVANGAVTLGDIAQKIISGSVQVNYNSDLGTVAVTGSIIVDDGKTVTLGNGTTIGSPVSTGTNGSVSGSITLDSGDYVKAYPGSTISKENFAAAVVSTEFYVDDSLYATVFANGTVYVVNSDESQSPITIAELNSIPGKTLAESTIPWKSSAGASVTQGSTAVGASDRLYVTMSSVTTMITVSSDPGVVIKIDGARYTTGTQVRLAVGSHFVTTALDGVTGSISVYVYFDGTKTLVEGDQFKITDAMVGKNVVIAAELGTDPVGPTDPTVPSEDYIVSVSYNDGKVIVSVIALDGGYIPATDVTVTFSGIGMKTILGQTVPAPVTIPETFNVTDDNRSNVVNETFELENIIGENLSIMGVSASIGQTNYGYMSLGYKP